LFCQVPGMNQLRLSQQNLPASFVAPQSKAKAPQPSTQAFPTKGNSSKNVKKKEHDANKREVLQAHAVQIQTLQNELESLRAQLANQQGAFFFHVERTKKIWHDCSSSFSPSNRT